MYVCVVLGEEIVSPPTKRRQSDEEVLLSTLFTDYNPYARPLINSSSTVVVSLQFSLMHIKDLVSEALLYRVSRHSGVETTVGMGSAMGMGIPREWE